VCTCLGLNELQRGVVSPIGSKGRGCGLSAACCPAARLPGSAALSDSAAPFSTSCSACAPLPGCCWLSPQGAQAVSRASAAAMLERRSSRCWPAELRRAPVARHGDRTTPHDMIEMSRSAQGARPVQQLCHAQTRLSKGPTWQAHRQKAATRQAARRPTPRPCLRQQLLSPAARPTCRQQR
jgi:hypothetical protein